MILFLHFLVVTAALLGFPGGYEARHAFEDFVSAPEMLLDEVGTVQLEEPVVVLVLLGAPVSLQNLTLFVASIFHLQTPLPAG